MRRASLRPGQTQSTAARPDSPLTQSVPGTGARAVGGAVVAGAMMCVFLAAKHALFPQIGTLFNRLSTSFFVALMVGGISFFVLRREEQLHLAMVSSETRYRLLFWKSLTGAYRVTLDGRILDCNVAFCQMFGYATREEVVGQSAIIGYFDETDRDRFLEKLKLEKELTNFEQRHRKKDGSAVWILLSVALVMDEAEGCLVIQGTTTDITERVAAQQESRVLADIVRCSDDAIFSISPEGVILTWNGGAERTYGYSSSEIVGRFVHTLSPKGRVEEVNDILEKMRGGCEFKNREVVRLRKDGQQIVIQLTVSPTTDLTGSITGASTIARDITDRKRSEVVLRQSEEQYRLLFESNPIPMWVFDRNTLRFLSVNQAAVRQYGYTKEEFLSKTILEIRPEDDVSDLLEEVAKRFHGIQERGSWRHCKKSGDVIDVEIVCHPLDLHGIESMLISAYDITERKVAEEAIRRAEEKYRAIFEDAVIGIFQATRDGRLTNVNRAFAQMYGFDRPPDMLMDIADPARQVFVDPDRMIELARNVTSEGIIRGAEMEIYRKDRTKRWVRINLRVVRDASDSIASFEGTVEDITERKVAEERIQFLAYHDALTELPNRALLRDRLDHALADARRRNEKVGLLFVDLDRFKAINDSFGHALGDLALEVVANRLRQCAREQDTVARVGGDEFLVLLNGLRDAADVAIAAERIMDAMNASFSIQNHSLSVGCSIGVSMFPEHGEDGETLIKNADAAMYFAKENGIGNVRFFSDEMNAQAVERLSMDKDLRLALTREEFFLMYQPQMEIQSGRITGFEALIRWQHPERGLIAPDKFITIAEDDGLILPIGEWVLRTACAQARSWQDDGLLAVPVAVNVSAVQFRQEGFCDLIGSVLEETGLSAEYLELELTESLLLSNADVTLSVLRRLKEMGLRLSIDDFGTGYSSLSYLKQFSIDKLKIDQSFIRDVAVSCNDAAIANAIISMAKSLHLKVIAEGVENEAQMTFLQEHQCDEIQGYYFSRPISAEDAGSMLQCAPYYKAAGVAGVDSTDSREVLSC